MVEKKQNSCELKGFLSFLVLHLISKGKKSGECITQEIEARKGCRPSPGTIYPVLKHLTEAELIEQVEESSKKKHYELTSKGKKEIVVARKKFMKLFGDLFSK